MQMSIFARAVAIVLALMLLVACSPATPPAVEAPREVSIGRLCEAMQLTDGMASTVLSLLESLGYEGEVRFAYLATDDSARDYYHVWIGEETVDVYLDPYGTVTTVRDGGVMRYEDIDPPPPAGERCPLTLLRVSDTVEQGDTASICLRAEAGATYRIEVHYSSGISSAKALSPKRAAPNGTLGWEWTVSSRVLEGEHRIRVVREGDESDALETSFRVVAAKE